MSLVRLEREEADRLVRERRRQALRAEAYETRRCHMTDLGERKRALRHFGITTSLKRELNDHEGIAEALKGLIHGMRLSQRALMPWNRGDGDRLEIDRWRLIGRLAAELRMAKKTRRRRLFKVVPV